MSVRSALRAAAGDTYRFSWRLLVLNTAVTGVASAVVLVVSAFPLVLLLAPLLAGPVVAALVHCTVIVVREDEFELADAVTGLRLHWRRGFALGGLFGAGLLLGALAVSFYTGEEHRALPLAALAVYVVAIYCSMVLVAWPLAIAEPQVSFADALRDAWLLVLRSPLRFLTLGAALVLVNALGAVTILPLLTMTIAYSFLVAGHLVLPRSTIQEEVTT
jgi:hypothetical protein